MITTATIKTTLPRPLRVFLCHSSADKPAVRQLYQRLRADGVEPWLDEEDLLHGKNWRQEIPKVVRSIDVVLVCLSHHAMTQSGYVHKEIKVALDVADEKPEGTIFVIPARLEECEVPDRLRHLHWVNLFEEKGYERLLCTLKTHAKAIGATIGLAPPSTKPEEVMSPFYTLPRRLPTMSPPIVQSEPPSYPVFKSDILTLTTPISFELILIPAGEFLMGNSLTENERPEHRLYLPNYYIAKTPVTNAQFAEFVQATGYQTTAKKEGWGWVWKGKLSGHTINVNWQYPRDPNRSIAGKDDHPVVQVSWYDALAYCNWLAEQTGKPFCLPSEAEWEKAARGTDGQCYPWGDEFSFGKCNSQWRQRHDFTLPDSNQDTTSVWYHDSGISPYGVLDTVGNVEEWTRSLWGRDWKKPEFGYPYDPIDGREVLEAGEEILRVLRGGSFLSTKKDEVSCARRYINHPSERNNYTGFRVMVSTT